MLGKYTRPRLLGLLIGIVGMTLFAAACSSDAATPTTPPTATSPAPTATAPAPKEVIRFHDGAWATLWLNNAIAMYITENGYGYPVEEVQGTTGTMKVALPLGELDVNMEVWRMNIPEWYDMELASGNFVDLAGTNDQLTTGTKGQILAYGGQGFYVPTYIVEENPGLMSVDDLPDYVDLFSDPEDPTKGVIYNCIIGWQCQKINQAKWFAYGLYDTFNVTEPGSAAALDANIVGAYEAGEPVLSYYWEPTSIINLRDMTRLEEPLWTAECQAALDLAVEASPYESTTGCGYPGGDVHTGVYSGLVDRAPEVTEFLANFFVGAGDLAVLEEWKLNNDKEWMDAAVKYLNENKDIWTTWITDANSAEIIADVEAALALEG